jgi:phosphotriesterase-related protein
LTAVVQTATGPIDTSALGAVLMHEHVIVLDSEREENYPELGPPWDEERAGEHAIEQLSAAKAAGYDTLVDVTVVPMGRNVGRIRRLSELSGVNIVVATGMYVLDVMPGPYMRLALEGGVDAFAGMFARDIEVGTADSGIRAGIIKVASDRQGLTPDVELMLRAAARAHCRTGVPITTHTSAPARSGLDQQRLFAEEGVDLGRVIIGHCDDTTDLDYLERLIDAGSWIGFDRLELDANPSRTERIATLATLCERGYADRLILSHDNVAFNNWGAAPPYQPGVYLRIPTVVLPALRERGVSEEEIDIMLAGNPRRIFELQGGY